MNKTSIKYIYYLYLPHLVFTLFFTPTKIFHLHHISNNTRGRKETKIVAAHGTIRSVPWLLAAAYIAQAYSLLDAPHIGIHIIYYMFPVSKNCQQRLSS